MAHGTKEEATARAGVGPPQLLQLGKERTDAMFNMQKELFDEYERASRAWVARVKSEVELWSELATKVTASRSIPEGLEAYRDCVSQRMQMAADDGRRLFEDGQKIIATVTKAVSKGLTEKTK
jgi:Phasin protein